MASIVEYVVASVAVIAVVTILYFKWAYGYWKRRNVMYIQPRIPLGNLKIPVFGNKGFNDTVREAYNEFKRKGARYGGIYALHKPILLPVDIDLIKNILTKDFQHFVNHGNLVDEKNEPLSANLLNIEDERWKNLRAKLTPTFTSGKMKMMFDAMESCADQMTGHIKTLTEQKKPLDIREIFSCYTTDIIGCCVFGIECDSFKNPDAEFRKYGRKVTEVNFAFIVRTFVNFLVPELNKVLNIRIFPKDVSDFFNKAFRDVVEQRVSTNTKRNDFVQLLLEINLTHGGHTKSLTMEEMVTQAFSFFVAGFETSSMNLTFCLYELAIHQDVQEKLRNEIKEMLARHNGKLTYEGLMEMKYVQQVIEETLRKYPPLPFLNRKCSKSYTVPGTTFTIEKDSTILISIPSVHMDEEYYPDPEKFDPDRFSKENKEKRPAHTYLPFGEGPRVCIGMRFSNLQVRMGLALILKDLKVLPHETTPRVMKLNQKTVFTVPNETILLNAQLV